ncbi:MAG: cyclophilin-like fold protein [bacterium]|nr:cyclophilin-like fold protein [bacterium]
MQRKKIKITAEPVSMLAELNETKTAELVWNALPITASANTWGEEIYFRIPVKTTDEKPQETVQLGDIGYWVPGNAFCIFFGKTPSSRGDEIRPYSPVTVIGKLLGDPKEFLKVKDGTNIIIEKAE